ncbi:gustatory and odorant receptor 22-like isoform X2 [Eupeodes corollae]|nr:gustatory and odorant receptor 22-like isoform X2 [Eupeodes corollae]
MPIVRSGPGTISFKWKSPQMAYALILYCFTTSLVVTVGYERLRIFQTTKKFDDYIYAVIFIIFLAPHFWIPFVGWGVANEVATYKTMWAHFQVRFYRVTGVSLMFPKLRIMIIILFVGCVSLAVVILYSLSCLLDGFLLWHTIAYFHIITMINMNAALLYINARAVKEASHSLSACFKKDTSFDCNSTVVSEYRILWLNLSEILQALGNAYARTYTTFCLFLSINITIAAFGALSEIFDSGFSAKVVGMLILTIYCTTLLFIVCDCAEAASNVVAEEIQHTLLTLDLSKIEIQTRREIDHFISAIEINPPVICMKGYSKINRQLLTSLFSKIAVYLIVLVQFKLSIVEQNKYLANVLANHTSNKP